MLFLITQTHTPETCPIDAGGIRYPAVITDGGTYKMWYVGIDLYGVGRIGYATSPDGIT
jgi:hypothetical protein